jgi:hypothetical protein
VRSVSAVTLSAAALALGVSGCVTTQEKNSWKVLLNARVLATQTPVRVSSENPGVRVERVQLVSGESGVAVAARLRNLTGHPLTDLPISVGVLEQKHARTYLNGRANLDYYDTHVPAIGAGATTIWVLPIKARTAHKLAGRPFAVVGVPTAPASTPVQKLPQLALRQQSLAGGDRLQVSVDNRSGLPQFGVQVYAVAARGGQYVAAARAAIGDLGGGASATVGMTLLGKPARGSVQLFAPPTIFK